MRKNLGTWLTPTLSINCFSAAPSFLKTAMAAQGSKQARAARSMPMISASFSCRLPRMPQRPLLPLMAVSAKFSST